MYGLERNEVIKRTALYVRVSTAEQIDGFSLDGQLKVLNDYCKSSGKVVVKEYVEKGVSGKSINGRLQLQQLLEDAKNGEFDEVVSWKINRLARNQLDLLRIVDTLNKNNVTFRSYSENFETETPMGKFALQMMGAVGELERNTIVDNVRLGHKQRARTGLWNGGVVLGYKSVNINEKDTRLEIIPEEALIVRKIFDLYASGKGLKAITNQLNHEGYKTKRGNMFGTTGIKDILMNPIYIGKIRYNVRENWSEKRRKGINKNPIIVDGEHEGIISTELWDKVQEMYKMKANKPKKTFESNYILTSIIKCPVCGASMVASRTKKKRKDGTYLITRYYVCGNWRNKGTAACNSNGVRAEYAEEYVLSRVKEVVLNEKIIKDIVKNLNKERKSIIKPLEKELERVIKSLKDLENRKDRVFELYEYGTIDKQTLGKRMKNITDEIELESKHRIQVVKELESNDSVAVPYSLVKKTLVNFHNLLEIADIQDKKTLLQLIISKITIKNKKDIDSIELHFDEKVQKHFINNNEGESPDDGGSPSFMLFTIKI